MAEEEEPERPYTEIVRGITVEKFSEIFNASARKARETYLHRHGIRKPKGRALSRPGAKNEARTKGLFETLKDKDDDEMVEEILRVWLLSKRELLSAALDHLGIEHDDGLTESDDVNKFEKLGKGELKKLAKVLEPLAPKEDVAVYLKFMGSQKVDEALG